jgi:aminoglycoside phosphotransferase (APT) family kinase protein
MNPPVGTPLAEVDITTDLVQLLLATQHPDLADLPLQLAESGWDNVIYRLGDTMAVRLPRRAAAADLIRHEQIWLPQIANRLPLPISAPLRTGTPTQGYPWHWSILPWLHGHPADQQALAASETARLGQFLHALHIPAPANAPANPVRGVPLAQRADAVAARIRNLREHTEAITPAIEQIWHAALQAPPATEHCWLHGDLHPRNVLADHGMLTGIIDWGDITAGDPATDLAAIWMLFGDPIAQQQALASYGSANNTTILRAKGWAVLFGVMLLDSGRIDNPRNAALGARILLHVANT